MSAKATKAEIQRSAAAAIAALKAAGETIGGLVIEGGKVTVLTGRAEAPLTDLERWEMEHGRRAS